MKTKKIFSLFLAIVLCLSSFTVFATDEPNTEKKSDKIEVFYNDEVVNFDVEPIIENDRTLVPMRAIFEAMGCAVYYSVADGKQIISARRADDDLLLTIGENDMYFNGEGINLDVPAKIKDDRTLVPLRAISEAFECEVYWYGDTKTIRIYSPARAYVVSVGKIAETITDDEGNVLIEAVAYYPVVENSEGIPSVDKLNSDYKWDADKFIEEAKAAKEDALNLRKELGDDFTPFVYELTYEENYMIWGYLSLTNHKYVNIGGAHPTKIMESRTYETGLDGELSLSMAIEEDSLDVPLVEFVTNLFVEKFKEIDPESSEVYTYDYISEYIGYVEFYITKNSMVLYFNQGEIAPYALGVISVEIPYEPGLFYMDMRHNYEKEHVFENEYAEGYEWRVIDYQKEKLVITEENEDYPPEKIYSELYPVGLNKLTVKGIKKGNAGMIFAHVKKGEGIETATQIYMASFYVDEDNMLTLVTEEDAMFLIEDSDPNVIYPLPETIDINNLYNCTVPVSFEKGDAYVDDTGKMVMDVMVYSYELYDMVDIASLEVDDIIVRHNEEIKITEIERLESGIVRINGGDDNGGFDLISNDNTVYYEVGMNDVKSYYELGTIILPVSDEFEYIDASDLDAAEKIYYPGDFLVDNTELEYNFSPLDTSIVIENGIITKMNKVYTP